MLEELKAVVEVIAQLPETALWLLAMFFFYKVFIVGTVYKVIERGFKTLHQTVKDMSDNKVKRIIEEKRPAPAEREIKGLLNGICITSDVDYLIEQMKRVKGKRVSIKSNWIHEADINWLKEAIDEKMDRELQEERDEKSMDP